MAWRTTRMKRWHLELQQAPGAVDTYCGRRIPISPDLLGNGSDSFGLDVCVTCLVALSKE